MYLTVKDAWCLWGHFPPRKLIKHVFKVVLSTKILSTVLLYYLEICPNLFKVCWFQSSSSVILCTFFFFKALHFLKFSLSPKDRQLQGGRLQVESGVGPVTKPCEGVSSCACELINKTIKNVKALFCHGTISKYSSSSSSSFVQV